MISEVPVAGVDVRAMELGQRRAGKSVSNAALALNGGGYGCARWSRGNAVSAFLSAFCIGVSFQIRVGCYGLSQRGGYSSGMY